MMDLGPMQSTIDGGGETGKAWWIQTTIDPQANSMYMQRPSLLPPIAKRPGGESRGNTEMSGLMSKTKSRGLETISPRGGKDMQSRDKSSDRLKNLESIYLQKIDSRFAKKGQPKKTQ
jgi:hypothetical protein